MRYFTRITFGVFAVTWVLSGLLSMNPLDLNPSRRPQSEQALLFCGIALTPSAFELPAGGFGPAALEAELIHYDSQPFYRVTQRDGTVRLVSGNSLALRPPEAQSLQRRAALLLPSARVAAIQWLAAFDDYYYTRHPERGDKPLPILRVKFADEQRTWFHINPITGQVTERITATNRVYRWLYNGLHSWDIRWLWERRPLWDLCVIGFSLGGLALSVLGVVIGVRRLREAAARNRSLRPAFIRHYPRNR